MLTKAKLQEYLDKGELVPIGTELITVQLGECEVKAIDKDSSLVYKCERKDGKYRWYNRFFKHEDIDLHTSLIDPTPPPLNSSFTREELEVLQDGLAALGDVVIPDKYNEIQEKLNMLLSSIQPKQKTLADLVGGDYCYVIINLPDLEFGKRLKVHAAGETQFEAFADGVDLKTFKFNDIDIVSPYPPTPQQIEAAEQAEIDAVKQRFEMLRKEAGK